MSVTPVIPSAPRITSTIVFGNGNAGAFRGLAYVVPETTRTIPDLGTLVPFATLFTDSFNIKQQSFTSGFPGALAQTEWFAIRYEGNFLIPRDGGWQFKLESHDAAVLYIDGVKVLDNDGRHDTRLIDGSRAYKAGIHQLRLDYFQSTGPVALSVYLLDKAGAPDVPLMGNR